ncbi:MAG TPA: hypothetical protein VKB78_03675 [Pirellulales bacterium]|nr:hypothetical protein [Pirellulales bacterium]
MSDRERWIVYPLLFLAIGMSLRDKLGLPTKKIVTEKIVVLNDNDVPVVEIGPTPEGNGAIHVRRGDREFSLMLGHEANESGLYVDAPAVIGRSRQSVLGDLSKLSADDRLEWLRGILRRSTREKKQSDR